MWNFLLGLEGECLTNPGGAVKNVYLLPNGYHLLSVSEDHKLRVWDLVLSKPLYTLSNHRDEITHLIFRDTKTFCVFLLCNNAAIYIATAPSILIFLLLYLPVLCCAFALCTILGFVVSSMTFFFSSDDIYGNLWQR